MTDELSARLRATFLEKRRLLDLRAPELQYSEYTLAIGKALSQTVLSCIDDEHKDLRTKACTDLGILVKGSQRHYLYEHQQHCCGLCGGSLESEEASTIDHIRPTSRGGTNSAKNKQLTHKWCNSRKGNRMIRRFDEVEELKHLMIEREGVRQ